MNQVSFSNIKCTETIILINYHAVEADHCFFQNITCVDFIVVNSRDRNLKFSYFFVRKIVHSGSFFSFQDGIFAIEYSIFEFDMISSSSECKFLKISNVDGSETRLTMNNVSILSINSLSFVSSSINGVTVTLTKVVYHLINSFPPNQDISETGYNSPITPWFYQLDTSKVALCRYPVPTPSQLFSISNEYSQTKKFTQSNKFSRSNQISQSNLFSETRKFSLTPSFSPSPSPTPSPSPSPIVPSIVYVSVVTGGTALVVYLVGGILNLILWKRCFENADNYLLMDY